MRKLLGLMLLFLLVVGSAAAQAQNGAAISTFLDPSLPSSGMGRAGAAVFWGDDPNDWSNPALLGYHHGFRYTYQRTQLVPDLAEDVYFTSRRLTLGVAGVGVSMAGKPFDDVGGFRLDYGKSEATNENGDVIGEFSSFEEIRQLAVGVNVVELVGTILHGPSDPGARRRLELSLGHAWKNVVVDLAPASVTLSGLAASGETKTKDRGALLRAVLVDRIGYEEEMRPGVLVEAAGAFSQRNYDDATISFIGSPDPVFEERLYGVAARATVSLPSLRSGWIWDLLSPTVAWGLTYEQARYYDSGSGGRSPIHRYGHEISVLGVLALRHGYIDDEQGQVHGQTQGFGIGLQYKGALGIRYDWARVPQSDFLDKVNRSGFTAFFDPYGVWKAMRHHGGTRVADGS